MPKRSDCVLGKCDEYCCVTLHFVHGTSLHRVPNCTQLDFSHVQTMNMVTLCTSTLLIGHIKKGMTNGQMDKQAEGLSDIVTS